MWGERDELEKYFQDPDSKHPFDWKTEFDCVLGGRGGFDFVLGNPPYINMEKLHEEQSYFKEEYPEIYAGKNDYLYYFVFKGISLLKQNGRLGFIVARYFIESVYAQKLREFLLGNVAIEMIIDFGNIQIFENVDVLTSIIVLRKESDADVRMNNAIRIVKVKKWNKQNVDLMQHITCNLWHDSFEDESVKIFKFSQSALTENSWNLTDMSDTEIKQKIYTNGRLLEELCEIEQGQKTGLNKVFCVDYQTVKEYKLEDDVLRRLVRNADIKKYYVDWNDLFLIYTTDSTDLDNYPNTRAYLKRFQTALECRDEVKDEKYPWWMLQRPHQESLFNVREKIIVPYQATENRFGYDFNQGYYGTTETYFIVPRESCNLDIKFILALLNSKCLEFYHKHTAKLKRDEYYEYYVSSLRKLPIAKIDTGASLYKKMIRSVEEIYNLLLFWLYSIVSASSSIINIRLSLNVMSIMNIMYLL